jgi:hypothetical protein
MDVGWDIGFDGEMWLVLDKRQYWGTARFEAYRNFDGMMEC